MNASIHVCTCLCTCVCMQKSVYILFMHFHPYFEGHFLSSESYFTSLSLFFPLLPGSTPWCWGWDPEYLCMLDKPSTTGLCLLSCCFSLKLVGFFVHPSVYPCAAQFIHKTPKHTFLTSPLYSLFKLIILSLSIH